MPNYHEITGEDDDFIWEKIIENEGKTFHTARGLPFTYSIKTNAAGDRLGEIVCIAKPDKRKSRKMTCRPFTDLIYKTMGWNKKCRYKMLGYRIEYEGEVLYVFDLKVPEIFHEKPKKGEEPSEPVNTRKGFYPDDIANTFGVSVEQEKKDTAVTEMDGFVSMAMLTGPQDKDPEQSGETPQSENADSPEEVQQGEPESEGAAYQQEISMRRDE